MSLRKWEYWIMKSQYRVKFALLFALLVAAPFLTYYSGSFGIFLGENLLSMISTGESIPLLIPAPQNGMWYFASASLGVSVACFWIADEICGLVSRRSGGFEDGRQK